jgi:glycosyltransferase involved in cell wall biosynthesis
MSRLTILMPVYNGEQFLRETMDSVLNQTYSDFLFLIINDGSTDSSEDIAIRE